MQDFDEPKLKVVEELRTDETVVEEAALLPAAAQEATPQASSYREWRKSRRKKSKLTPSALLFIMMGAIVLALGMRYVYYGLPETSYHFFERLLERGPRLAYGFMISLFGFLLITKPLLALQDNERITRVHTILSKIIQAAFAVLMMLCGLLVPFLVVFFAYYHTLGILSYAAILMGIASLGTYWMYCLFPTLFQFRPQKHSTKIHSMNGAK
jgi:hypothetical protein